MKREALLVSIQRIRMLEVDGVGAYAKIDLLVAKRPPSPKTKPHFKTASLIMYAYGERHPRLPGRVERRWEAR